MEIRRSKKQSKNRHRVRKKWVDKPTKIIDRNEINFPD